MDGQRVAVRRERGHPRQAIEIAAGLLLGRRIRRLHEAEHGLRERGDLRGRGRAAGAEPLAELLPGMGKYVDEFRRSALSDLKYSTRTSLSSSAEVKASRRGPMSRAASPDTAVVCARNPCSVSRSFSALWASES